MLIGRNKYLETGSSEVKLQIQSLSIKNIGSVKLPYFVFRWMQHRKSKLFVFGLLKLVGLIYLWLIYCS